jgi:DNA repair exonuclease SbcCD nuclease subunit
MKLLITADLHFRLHWFRWLIEQAPDFDLVCIAGDLLDMLKTETRLEQAREVTRLIRELGDIVPIAVCSGNHDNADRLVGPQCTNHLSNLGPLADHTCQGSSDFKYL